MNTLNLPGFTAEYTLAGSDITYRHDAYYRYFMARRDDSLHPAMTRLDRACARLWGFCLRGGWEACVDAERYCGDWLDNL